MIAQAKCSHRFAQVIHMPVFSIWLIFRVFPLHPITFDHISRLTGAARASPGRIGSTAGAAMASCNVTGQSPRSNLRLRGRTCPVAPAVHISQLWIQYQGEAMVQQGLITINGYVGSDPVNFGKDASACSFRIGCTRRYFDNTAKEWKDRPTIWITVKAFRALARNVAASVHKGDPIIVSGTLANEQWERDGETHSRTVIEAASIGHDLGLGVSQFTRHKPGFAPGTPAQPQQATVPNASNQAAAPQTAGVEHGPGDGPRDPYAEVQDSQKADSDEYPVPEDDENPPEEAF